MNNVTQHDKLSTLGPEFDSPDCEPQLEPIPGKHPQWEPVERLLDEQAEGVAELVAVIEEQRANEKAIMAELRSELACAEASIAELEAALR